VLDPAPSSTLPLMVPIFEIVVLPELRLVSIATPFPPVIVPKLAIVALPLSTDIAGPVVVVIEPPASFSKLPPAVKITPPA